MTSIGVVRGVADFGKPREQKISRGGMLVKMLACRS